jgi:Spy/CpxP family protein refolding chaperone
MKRMNLRNALRTVLLTGGPVVATSALAQSQGGYGMGPGMMGDYGPQAILNLSAEQRGKIAKIQEDARHKQWELMGKMQEAQAHMNEQYYSDNRDDAALSKDYRKMSELRHQMFDLSLSTQKQTDAVLTKEQHGKSWRNGYGMWGN